MMDRRSFVVGVPAVAIAGLAVAPAVAGASVQWRECLADWRKAEAAYNAAIDAQWAAEAAFDAIAPATPKGGLVLQSGGESFTLDEACHNMREEADRHRLHISECRERSGLASADQALEQAEGQFLTARNALLDCAAPDIPAVVIKAEIVRDYGLGIDAVVVDLKRLQGGSLSIEGRA